MASGRLVRDLMLTDFPFLASLASSGRASDRRIWLKVATDHFIAAESGDADRDRRIRRRDVGATGRGGFRATRLEIARKLSPCVRVPARLFAELTSIDSDACDYVLEHAVACDDRELERPLRAAAEERSRSPKGETSIGKS